MPVSGYSGIFENSPAFGLGVGAEIIRILRAYNKSLPVPFLAHVLHRSIGEIDGDVTRLQQIGVLKREKDQVSLAE